MPTQHDVDGLVIGSGFGGGMTLFKDVFIVSGSGVGGGSLGYANTLNVPLSPVSYEDPQWAPTG